MEVKIGPFVGPIATLDDHVLEVANRLCLYNDVWVTIGDQLFGEEAHHLDPVNEGKKRRNVHSVDGTKRFFRNDKHGESTEDIIGLFGEKEFGMQFGLPVDVSLCHDGDGHVDFVSVTKKKRQRITIDVKTYRKPINLLVKKWETEMAADILVLAGFSEDETPKVILKGWEYGKNVLTWPVRDFGYGITNRYLGAPFLYSMDKLKELLGVSFSPLQPLGIKERIAEEMVSRGYTCKFIGGMVHFLRCC